MEKVYTKEELEVITRRYEKSKQTTQRVWIRNLLLCKKAKEKGITVSEAEVDTYLKNKQASK